MNSRLLIVALAVLVLLGYDRWQHRPLRHAPGVLVAAAPAQKVVPESVFGFDDYILTRRARFSLEARVLSTERYWLGRESDLAPVDLALGWGPMSDQSVLDRIEVSQGGRWYFTRWEYPAPLPEREVGRHSGNMHIIPDRPFIEKQVKSLRPGDLVRLEGFLVDVDHPSGWHWRTSLSRDDSGNGACEVFYVESLSVITGTLL